MASFMASVCSAALSRVMLPLRMPLPMFSTGVQQLPIWETMGWSTEVRAAVSFWAITTGLDMISSFSSRSVLQGITLRSSKCSSWASAEPRYSANSTAWTM